MAPHLPSAQHVRSGALRPQRWRRPLEALTFVGEVPQDELPPAPESTSDVLVVRTYRVSVEMDEWITRTTREHGIRSNSELVRELLELGRAAMESNDRQVSMADVLRALAQVRSRNAA